MGLIVKQLVKILKKYGIVKRGGNVYELTLKITPDFLQIPSEYLREFPICRKEWKIEVRVSNDSFEIKTVDQEADTLSKDEQKEVYTFLNNSVRASGIVLDGLSISKNGTFQNDEFKESIGRIISIVKGYCRLLGDQILSYMVFYSIACFCGSQVQYSKFKFKCTNPKCGFSASLSQINESLKILLYLSDVDSTGISRKGEIAYYLNRTHGKDNYKIVKITNIERKKWVINLPKKTDILKVTKPSLFYWNIEFHPLQRRNEENVPIFLCWVDISGDGKLLRKKDIQNGYAILLKLDKATKIIQAFKPTSSPNENVLLIENYDLPVEIPKNVKSRIKFHEKTNKI